MASYITGWHYVQPLPHHVIKTLYQGLHPDKVH